MSMSLSIFLCLSANSSKTANANELKFYKTSEFDQLYAGKLRKR